MNKVCFLVRECKEVRCRGEMVDWGGTNHGYLHVNFARIIKLHFFFYFDFIQLQY